MSEGIGRLEVLATLLTVAGALMFVRSGARLLQVAKARFTYGAPYHRGMIADRALGLLMTVPVLAFGILLAFLVWAQWGFQPNEATVRVARVEARRSGWGKVTVRLILDPLYPAHEVLEGEVAGARWAVAGDFVSWSRGVRWLGLRNGHRVRYLLGTRDTTGLSSALADQRRVLEPLPDAASHLLRAARFIPFLTVRTESSPWFPIAERQILTLYAIGPGYLADFASEGQAARPY